MSRREDLVSYVSARDVRVVLDRVPSPLRARLRDVFHSRDSNGARRLGSVRRRGRRDITLYSVLPPRLSLGRYIGRGQSPSEFGAPARGQWPPWAVRRFLLYDVLLHELGHLQLVRPHGRGWDRKYASETLAQQFADELRRELWSQPFEHPDPVHNPPESDERKLIPVWAELNKERRFKLVRMALSAPHVELPDISWLGDAGGGALSFLRRALCYPPLSNSALQLTSPSPTLGSRS